MRIGGHVCAGEVFQVDRVDRRGVHPHDDLIVGGAQVRQLDQLQPIQPAEPGNPCRAALSLPCSARVIARAIPMNAARRQVLVWRVGRPRASGDCCLHGKRPTCLPASRNRGRRPAGADDGGWPLCRALPGKATLSQHRQDVRDLPNRGQEVRRLGASMKGRRRMTTLLTYDPKNPTVKSPQEEWRPRIHHMITDPSNGGT